MKRMTWLLVAVTLGCASCAAPSGERPTKKESAPAPATQLSWRVSQLAGINGDSDVLQGGGTDDTQVLQAALDGLAKAGGGELLVAGPAWSRAFSTRATLSFAARAGGPASIWPAVPTRRCCATPRT